MLFIAMFDVEHHLIFVGGRKWLQSFFHRAHRLLGQPEQRIDTFLRKRFFRKLFRIFILSDRWILCGVDVPGETRNLVAECGIVCRDKSERRDL